MEQVVYNGCRDGEDCAYNEGEETQEGDAAALLHVCLHNPVIMML